MKYNKQPEFLSGHIKKWSAMQLWIYCDVYTMQSNGNKYYRTNKQLATAFKTDERTIRRIISGFVLNGVFKSYQDRKQRFLYAKNPEEWKEDSKVPGQQSPRTAKSPMEDNKVREGGQQSPFMEDNKVPQIEKLNREVNKEENTELDKLIFPFDSDGFKAAWKRWKRYQRNEYRNYYNDPQTEQSTLKLISNECTYDTEAIDAIDTAISKGWKGLVFDSSNGRGFKPSGSGGIETSDNRAKLEEYIRTGRITTDRRNVL
jgi:hypothetical protein